MNNVVRFKRKKPTGEPERPIPSPRVIDLRPYQRRREAGVRRALVRKCIAAVMSAGYGAGDAIHCLFWDALRRATPQQDHRRWWRSL